MHGATSHRCCRGRIAARIEAPCSGARGRSSSGVRVSPRAWVMTGAILIATTLLGSSLTSIPLVPSEGVGRELIQTLNTGEIPASEEAFHNLLQSLLSMQHAESDKKWTPVQNIEDPIEPSIWNRIVTYFYKHVDERDGKVTVHLLVEGWLERANEELRSLNAKEAELAWWVSTRQGWCCSGQRLSAADAPAYAQQLGLRRTAWRRAACRQARLWLTLGRLLRARQRRQITLLCRGPQFSAQEAADYANLSARLQQVYASAKVCYPRDNRCYYGEEEVDRLMRTSRRPKFLEWLWVAWRDAVGKPARPLYRLLVPIMNSAAKRANYSDMGECWREELDTPRLEEEVFRMYEEVEPLYMKLHAVVRYHLANHYGDKVVDRTGLIPAHLLGNMWGQNWAAVADIVLPAARGHDVGRQLRRRATSVLSMVHTAEDLCASMGLPRMPDSFWQCSQFRRMARGSVTCHGTAANMFQGHDYRMIFCAEVSREDYEVIHHEMGHIEYYMAYENQPAIFREGATSAVQEAVGDAVSLAAGVPAQLRRLSLTNDSAPPDEINLALLLLQAMTRLPQLPFALAVEKWRWDVFRGVIAPESYNHDWWHLRKKYLGIVPPARRSEADFDPGSKFHVANNVPYIRYFLSGILQVQIFKGMCQYAVFGEITEKPLPFPLHQCDIYGSKRSGAALWHTLKLGRSRPWTEALKGLTGSKYYDVKPLLEYYAPLNTWLEEQIEKYKIPVGWEQ